MDYFSADSGNKPIMCFMQNENVLKWDVQVKMK